MKEKMDKVNFDASGIIERAGGRRRKLSANISKDGQSPEDSSPDLVKTPVNEPVKEKEEPRRRKTKAEPQDYETLFFKESPIKTRNGKVVYIRKEFHDRITKIVRVIGENEFSLFSYLDNVLEHHFNSFQNEITEIYRKKNTDVF